MDKILTLCIATYNMEEYLDRCLSSITAADVPTSLEILVVNDGSKDDSLKIAKYYQAKRPDIIRIIDKENGNYGSCVNKAIEFATGKYFRMLDADDYFDSVALLSFLNELNVIDADLIVTNFTRIYKDKKNVCQLSMNSNIKYNTLYSIDSLDISKLENINILCMHSMTYKLDVIKKTGLKLLEGISYTDTEYCYYPIYKSKSILFMDINLYQYDMSRDGQTISVESLKKSAHHIEMIAERMIINANVHTTVPSIALYFLQVIVKFYYESVLIHCPYVNRINYELSLFDKKLLNLNVKLYKYLQSLKVYHLPYVLFWRMSNRCYFSKFIISKYIVVFSFLFKMLKRGNK